MICALFKGKQFLEKKNQSKKHISLPYSLTMNFFMSSPLHLLSFTLLLHSVTCMDPLFHFCSKSKNYTSNGPYEKNLNMLVSYLSTSVPTTGYSQSSIGKGQDVVNGLALCRGDVASKECKYCVIEASSEIRNRCPNDKGAIIWYDYCLLKYSDVNFFGKIAYENRFYMWNINKVSDPESFNKKTRELLIQLSAKAHVTPLLFATGEEQLGESEKLYGLVQCTRDLSSTECKKCLDDAISELPNCCDGKEGGRVVGGSCNFRYELYPFVNS